MEGWADGKEGGGRERGGGREPLVSERLGKLEPGRKISLFSGRAYRLPQHGQECQLHPGWPNWCRATPGLSLVLPVSLVDCVALTSGCYSKLICKLLFAAYLFYPARRCRVHASRC